MKSVMGAARAAIAAAAIAGIALATGCEREHELEGVREHEGVVSPERPEGLGAGKPEGEGDRAEELYEAMVDPSAVDERAPEQQPARLAEGTRVAPGVAILAIDVDCAATPVFFETGSAALGDDDRRALRGLASCLRGTPEAEHVEVVGMTSPPASEGYNDVLAHQRALNVASFLRLNGVEEGKFEIRAIGERGATEGMPSLYPAQRAAVAIPRQ